VPSADGAENDNGLPVSTREAAAWPMCRHVLQGGGRPVVMAHRRAEAGQRPAVVDPVGGLPIVGRPGIQAVGVALPVRAASSAAYSSGASTSPGRLSAAATSDLDNTSMPSSCLMLALAKLVEVASASSSCHCLVTRTG
jgi:hypothetical protein